MRKRKIILVDDEPNILNAIARILQNDNYEIIKFENATDVLSYMQKNNTGIDLIISDNKMPEIANNIIIKIP